MRHRPVDLASEIQRASLPRGLAGFLFPLFEAVSNALHSIEDRFGDDVPAKGSIRITFDQTSRTLAVVDNGEGFSIENVRHFLTPFTGHKFQRNGKGFGRFISFKIFDEVFYSSRIETAPGHYELESYEYKPLSDEDNLVPIRGSERIPSHPHDRGLSVLFCKPREDYISFFDLASDDIDGSLTELDVVECILDHFLLDFIQGKTPNDFIFDINGVKFNLTDYFASSIRNVGRKIVPVSIDGTIYDFEFTFMQIEAGKAKQHDLYFYVDNRATSDLEHISKGLKDNAFEDDAGRKYFYLVAATSSFFRASQSRDKIENLNAKIDGGTRAPTVRKELTQIAKNLILGFEPEYESRRRNQIRKNVEELIALDPILRRGLGGRTLDEFVNSRGILESKEQLAADLFIERQRQKFDFRKINSTTPYEDLQRVVRENIRDEAKEALAVYVAYRSNTIRIFKEMLNRQDGRVAKEDAVHELVYPRYKDSEEINYDSHNLWLIDDDLAYAEYISSDRTTAGKGRAAGDYAHDLLINNQDELLVVEMKRPMKKTFEHGEEPKSPTDNPVQQVKDQVAQIRDRGKIISSGGRDIIIKPDRMVRAYVLMDWNEKLEAYLKREEFVLSNQGGPMAYRYFPWHNMIVEVLAFDRLADRAAKRNEVFESILKGQSNHTGKKQDPLLVSLSAAAVG
ncbi:Histidine kinase-, DNA gyrase B-, and HSP90-like ATPase [[Luteovulum] sphaeroides subsp. megalophilum]|nr:Histidine kinase-, DNA gyrase B-, and HSP90-like ATPase [[Luteovulum] sphaeroides subsp. megalophilum]